MKNFVFYPGFVWFLFFSLYSFSQSYNFPVKPGDDAWKALKTGAEKYEVCQIPEVLLSKINTKDLISTNLDYPLLSTIMAYGTVQEGYEKLTLKFNGLQELIKRKDAGVHLLNFYSKMNPDAIANRPSLVEKGRFSFEMQFIEILLAQTTILGQLSMTDRNQLVSICIEKQALKRKNAEYFGLAGEASTIRIIGRIMEIGRSSTDRSSLSPERKLFLEEGVIVDFSVAEGILSEAKKL